MKVERVGKGSRQPVYYQGSIEKHLGTNRTPPPVTPKPFSPCQPGPFRQTPGGERRKTRGDRRGGRKSGVVGWMVRGLKMEYPSTTLP